MTRFFSEQPASRQSQLESLKNQMRQSIRPLLELQNEIIAIYKALAGLLGPLNQENKKIFSSLLFDNENFDSERHAFLQLEIIIPVYASNRVNFANHSMFLPLTIGRPADFKHQLVTMLHSAHSMLHPLLSPWKELTHLLEETNLEDKEMHQLVTQCFLEECEEYPNTVVDYMTLLFELMASSSENHTSADKVAGLQELINRLKSSDETVRHTVLEEFKSSLQEPDEEYQPYHQHSRPCT